MEGMIIDHSTPSRAILRRLAPHSAHIDLRLFLKDLPTQRRYFKPIHHSFCSMKFQGTRCHSLTICRSSRLTRDTNAKTACMKRSRTTQGSVDSFGSIASSCIASFSDFRTLEQRFLLLSLYLQHQQLSSLDTSVRSTDKSPKNRRHRRFETGLSQRTLHKYAVSWVHAEYCVSLSKTSLALPDLWSS